MKWYSLDTIYAQYIKDGLTGKWCKADEVDIRIRELELENDELRTVKEGVWLSEREELHKYIQGLEKALDEIDTECHCLNPLSTVPEIEIIHDIATEARKEGKDEQVVTEPDSD